MKQLQKSDLKEGDIYVSDPSYDDSYTYLNKHSLNGRGFGFNLKLKKDFRSDWLLSYKNMREATPEEKHWLETCIKADKFISYEEAMKSFIPEYVECIEDIRLRHNCYGELGKVYIVVNWNHSTNDCMLLGTTSGSTSKTRFKASTKEAYDAQFVVKKPEFVLPQKWCITTTKENQKIVIDWLNKNTNWKNGFNTDISIGNHYCINGTNCQGWMYFAPERKNGYFEITTEQFKQYVLKEKSEIVLEEAKDKILQYCHKNSNLIKKVECSEGGIYKLGDKITVFDKTSPNKGKIFTIKSFRWTNDKSKICAITELHTPNGIGLDKIELYVEPKVEITHNFKIGDKISIITKHLEISQPHYLDKIFVIEKIENNRLIINNETNSLNISNKSVLAKNVKLVESKQELSLLEQAKLKYPVGTKFKGFNAATNQIALIIGFSNGIFTFGNNGNYINCIRAQQGFCYTPEAGWAEIVEDFVLPEYWYITLNSEEEVEIAKKYFSNCLNYVNSLQIKTTVGYTRGFDGIVKHWHSLTDQTKNKTTEITFDQFKKYVLNEML